MTALGRLPADVRVLIVARIVRLFAYGMLSVVLVLYLTTLGLGDTQIGTLLALTLLGDLVISLAITTTADRLGRRRMLVLGAALVVVAGGVFAATSVVPILTIAAIVGVISPSG